MIKPAGPTGFGVYWYVVIYVLAYFIVLLTMQSSRDHLAPFVTPATRLTGLGSRNFAHLMYHGCCVAYYDRRSHADYFAVCTA